MYHDQEFLNIQNHLFAFRQKNNKLISYQFISLTGRRVNTSFIAGYSFSVLSALSFVTIFIDGN
jgi:hypothetical protein